MEIALGNGALGRWVEKNRGIKALNSNELHYDKFDFIITFGTQYMKERKTEWDRLIGLGYKPIENGNIIQNCIIESELGSNNVFCNGCIVEHDIKIGNHNYVSPGAVLLSHVEIGDSNLIGANATILPGRKIGNECLIGAGAVVRCDVLDNTMVAGVPAEVKRSNEW